MALAACVCAVGCVADGTDFEALPFIRIDRTEPEVTKVDVPPLLLTVDTAPGSRRKLLTEEGEDGEEREVEEGSDYLVRFPYPFGRFMGQGGRHSWTFTGFLTTEDSSNSGPAGRAMSSDSEVRDDLFPAFSSDAAGGGLRMLPFVFSSVGYDHNDLHDTDGSAFDHDVSLSPFFMAGWGDSDDDDYLAVAPFGGVTKGLLGKKKITWFGFPYPLYANVQDRSYESHHILFPFVNWIDGPRNSGFRVLPFYGHYERKGLRGNPIYERTFIMWPFFTWSRSGLNEDVPTETFFLFPFFGRLTSDGLEETTVLWPFFKYTEQEEDEGSRWQLRAPFPFFIVGGGKDRWQLDLWPVFGMKHRKNFDRTFALWPIFRREKGRFKDLDYNGTWVLPIFWRTYWHETNTGREKHKWHSYPFASWKREYTGERSLDILAPWPWADDDGWTRILAPFVRLYRYHRDADGGVEHQFLLGLFSYRDLPAVPERNKKDYFRLSFLFGLFQYRNLGGERGLRFLWLPEFPTWGGDD